jgi:nitrite reductase (NADH) small subunit
MALVKVATVGDLPPGRVREIEFANQLFALCNANGEIHCVAGTCPHAGGPLGQGALHGEMLVCPWHGWEFSCVTGVNDVDEDLTIDKYPVVVRGQDVLIEIPAR